MRVLAISTIFVLIFISFATAKSHDDKVPNQENWQDFYPQICPVANSYKLRPVIFRKDFKTEYDIPFIIEEGDKIKPRKVNSDGSITKAHFKNISLGEIGRRQKKIPLSQRIAFLNEENELVTEDGKPVSESNPVERYSLESTMLNFVGRGEEPIEKNEHKVPEPKSFDAEASLIHESESCSYLQTSPQFYTSSNQWRRFDARYVCSSNVIRRFSLSVDTNRFTKTFQTEVQPRMLFMKNHKGEVSRGSLDSLKESFESLSDECDWVEVKLNK